MEDLEIQGVQAPLSPSSQSSPRTHLVGVKGIRTLGRRGDEVERHDSEQEKPVTEDELTRQEEDANYHSDEEFEKVLKEGPEIMRRGTLDSINGEVNQARRSHRDLLKTLRDTKKKSDEVDFVLDNSLRKFTIAQAVMARLQERLDHSRERMFVQGSAEHKNLLALRKHANTVVELVRKNKLREEVNETKAHLRALGDL